MDAQYVAVRRRPATPPLASLLAVALALPVIAWPIGFGDPGGFLLVASYGTLGLVLALRRPGQPLAWLLLMIAAGLAMGTTRPTASFEALLTGSVDPLGIVTAWANGVGWAFIFGGFLGILLVFPDGSLPDGRWRIVGAAAIVVFAVIAGLLVFGPVITVSLPERPEGANVPNPLALPPLRGAAGVVPDPSLLWPGLFIVQLMGMAVMFARFRRSQGLARLQYRWLWWAFVVVVVGTLCWVAVTFILDVQFSVLAAIFVAVTYPAIPLAIVVAVLRYRLYEIDRLVSRSVGWALATAAIVGVFAAGVLGFGALLSGLAQGQAVATAAATLLAFALFQPVRTRLQRIIDRRFDRPRIEGEQALRQHGARLAHVVELEVIERDVLETVAATVRPASTSLWIRPSRHRT